jgi:hypothetical protein
MKQDKLRDLLRRNAEMARQEALESNGQIQIDRIESLKRLRRLVDICERLEPTPPPKRWPVLAVLASALVLISILLFGHVSETEIELDSTLSEVGFELPKAEALTSAITLSALGAFGVREIEIPRTSQGDVFPPSSQQGDSAVQLSLIPGRKDGGISLEPIVPAGGARVWVQHKGIPQQYRLSLASSGTELHASVDGSLHVSVAGVGTKQLKFSSPKTVILKAGSNNVDLDLTLPSGLRVAFTSELPARNLDLSRIEEFDSADRSLVRRVSTILSGVLYRESVGEEQKLRAGESLQFEASEGEIHTLSLDQDHIVITFHGQVRGMNLGSGEGRRNLMPTWLEWLKARHGLSLLWGTSLYVMGLVLGVLRWWRTSS